MPTAAATKLTKITKITKAHVLFFVNFVTFVFFVAAAVGTSQSDYRGFVFLARTWERGDTVTLELPMEPRRVTSGTHVADNTGKVALPRGPIVYALEAADNGGTALDKTLPPAPVTHAFRRDLFGGVGVLQSGALTFIPYDAWANRGAGEMAVWIR